MAKACGRSVILFWLSGGPGHMETWDPKPDAPASSAARLARSPPACPEPMSVSLLPEQARRMDRLAILRSVNHGSGDHTKGNHWMLTGYEGPAFNAPDNEVQRRPSMGSAVARLKGAESRGYPLMSPCRISVAAPITCSTTRRTSAAMPTRSSPSRTRMTHLSGSRT